MKRVAIAIVLVLALLLLTRGVAPSIGSTRVYRIARDTTWFPLQVRGKEKNIQAFTDELLRRIAEEEGFEVQLISAPYDTHIPLLNKKSCDGVVTTVQPVKRYTDRYEFSEPFLILGSVLVVAENSPIKSLDDMHKMTLGVRAGSSFLFDFPQQSDIAVKMYTEINRALDDCAHGEVQGVIIDRMDAEANVRGYYRGRLQIAGQPLNAVGLRIMTPKDERADLVDAFNGALKELQRTNTVEQLVDKWGVFK
ncbi:MAG: transporter substrate-binding domain-containing protein [Chlamydiia bacterium]|nr:transporter substrate-binding domain-containing protein [Chlamydiia bacterium]